MFDIGFSELVVVGLVALVVLGPERLPKAARTVGILVGRLRNSFNSIKADVERELGAQELRLQLRNEEILRKEREMLEKTALEAKDALNTSTEQAQDNLEPVQPTELPTSAAENISTTATNTSTEKTVNKHE